MNIFSKGKSTDLSAVLLQREKRSHYQNQLEQRYPNKIVISFKLNIPGPIKNNDYLARIFQTGWRVLLSQLTGQVIEHSRMEANLNTGPEAFLVVTGNLSALKQLTIKFEDNFPLGRLFDVDLMAGQDEKYQLSRQDLGFAPRTCLICNQDAKSCIKIQRHSLMEAYQVINSLYANYYQENFYLFNWGEDTVINAALTALLDEVTVTPKPGLVDPASNGSHQDMTAFTFIESSLALRPYFVQAFELGHNFQGTDLTSLFEQVRQAGIQAEQAMYLATQGVNTHKGLIFSLGIMIAALAQITRTGPSHAGKLRQTIQAMTANLVATDLQQGLAEQKALTAGQQQYQRYQLTGIRGEAAQAFPMVFELALPFLGQATGADNQRYLDTLMLIAGQLADSTLIKRAGSPAILAEMRAWSAEYFALGGSQREAGRTFLANLDQDFIKRNLSLGGAADTLVLTIFLARLQGVV
ncbi:triphosphoribosyl-dephospho-CoA synthase CitG [Convivina praedatoris]|uniref:Probable 2-(5''-triphosphoribosyl)-3'-dephosphocoenzyme-A synthase n=1 Tax=Convivina praedatoris TaxID=2880963 RepID=A0ABN8H9K3_9LACO|nr:triphosphoribosyl-dephospho-CoA synthase CitG [Convivina sp. LMG 32447]CAH1853717.1 2-(5''-triphosphoribosyl)-3'-dephosphocoenzyme-A synthase [Convivina sp. LMG 32447]CAH1854672.1 2-(5''-triphosphoribosyl)-3'-dephosphocoenzyme-A synthase [Convivina sp. LMG 32447]CAH1855181.1 2-(5''-triphosphoribosyl)-3'-dephosphocoenzyme-A synthase [Convivina sp. LMG 32447]